MMRTIPYPKAKQPILAATLAVLFGPFGYLYFGWRYAMAAVVLFALSIIVFSQVLFVPQWLKYINWPIFAVVAIQICKIWNAIVKAKHDDAFALNTFPVAIFAITTFMPFLVGIDTVVVGVSVGIQRMLGNQVSEGLAIVFLATPFLTIVHVFVSSLAASGIDWIVLRLVPDASTNIFPVAIGYNKSAIRC